jgi:hypothetical protein
VVAPSLRHWTSEARRREGYGVEVDINTNTEPDTCQARTSSPVSVCSFVLVKHSKVSTRGACDAARELRLRVRYLSRVQAMLP